VEQAVINMIASLGVAGLGYLFLWVFVQRTFKQADSAVGKIDGLTSEIHALTVAVGQLHEAQEVSHVVAKVGEDISEIRNTNEKILFGTIAIEKKYMTLAQVREVLAAQGMAAAAHGPGANGKGQAT